MSAIGKPLLMGVKQHYVSRAVILLKIKVFYKFGNLTEGKENTLDSS